MDEEPRVGEVDGGQITEVVVRPDDGGEAWLEMWRGVSKRHALSEAREHYRDKARVDVAKGETY